MCTSDPPAVALVGLTKSYGGANAVSDVDLTIASGELICLLGSSGSGKTTLLRLIAGFESPTSGRITLHGTDVSALSPADRHIGMVFQNYALFPHLTVARNIAYGLKMRGWSASRRRERTNEMLERMRLERLGDRFPRQLSGGQQQRVAIARALAYEPRLLLMDEPLGALDKALKQELLGQIRRVHREFSTTIIYVTHDREEALTLADRVALMRDSKLVACEAVQDMYLHPTSAYAAEFFSGANLLSATVTDRTGDQATLSIAGSERKLTVDRRLGASAVVAVRPRDLTIEPGPDDWPLEGHVEDRVFLGDDVQLKVIVGEGASLTVLAPLSRAASLTVGDAVTVGFSPDVARVFPSEMEGSA